jgi:hypothetical protein
LVALAFFLGAAVVCAWAATEYARTARAIVVIENNLFTVQLPNPVDTVGR